MNGIHRIDGGLVDLEWTPGSRRQAELAAGAAGVLVWSYALRERDLPRWVVVALRNRGLRIASRIGSTTYRSSTWRLEAVVD